jgi:hypothetical protein
VKQATCIFSGAALAWMVATGCIGASSRESSDLVYADAERTSEIRISGGNWFEEPIPAREFLARDAGANPFVDSVGHAITNCSDTTLQCLKSWGRTLAVPRVGLRKNLTYRKNGVFFRVDDCLRSDHDQCQVAIVSAECQQLLRDGSCRTSSSDAQQRYDYVAYFIYNDDFGITALGMTNNLATTYNGRRMIATQNILVGNSGLLKN